MSLRPAHRPDEDFFYYWRLRDEREGLRAGWYLGGLTTREQHREWFAENLHKARLFVWEHGAQHERLGVARIDTNGELQFSCEPRWAPRLLESVAWFASLYGGRLKAVVDEGDVFKLDALRGAGFVEFPARFLVYRP